MRHVSPEALWEYASAGQPPGAEAAEVAKHVAECAECRAQLAQVQQAQAVLKLRPMAPPPLDPIAMRRIGAVLKERAAEELGKKRWFSFDVSIGWALGGVAAVLVALLVWGALRPLPPVVPVAKPEQPVPPKEQVAQHVEPPKPVAVPPAAKLLAQVTQSKNAKSANAALQKSQSLGAGSQVATAAGGALWLKLPDGSRAGLTGSTDVQLDTLEEKKLGLSLNKGNLLVVARHLPERVLTVKAGEVEVRDIGTRFLVSRDVNRVLVAVEEGVVEVNAPGSKLTLRAGRSAEWREGRFEEQAWTPAPPPEQKVKISSPPTPAIVAVTDAGPAEPLANPEEEWGTPANLPKTGIVAPPNGTVAVPPAAAPADVEEEEKSVLSLEGLEQRVKKVTRVVKAPFAAVGRSMRETRAHEIGRLADEGNCPEALKRADEWLSDGPTDSKDEPRWRRMVQVNQLRCYTRLHRDADARRVQDLLQ